MGIDFQDKFEQFEAPLAPPSQGNIFTPEAPDASKPITDVGTTHFIRHEDVDDELIPLGAILSRDSFRRDVNNVYGRVQQYKRFGLLRTPEPSFPPNPQDPKQPTIKLYSDELSCHVYMEKVNLPTVELLDLDPSPLTELVTEEQYTVFLEPDEYKGPIDPESPAYSPTNIRPPFSSYLEANFLPPDSLSSYPSHNFKINLANQAKSPEESQFEKDYVHFKSHYNFYESPYEEAIEGVDEKVLPNLYTFMTVLSDKSSALSYSTQVLQEGSEVGAALPKDVFYNKFWAHASLNNQVSSLYPPPLQKGTPLTKGQLIKQSPLSRYFDDWSEALPGSGFGAPTNVGQPQMANADPGFNSLQAIVQNYSRIFVPDLGTTTGVLQYNKLARNFPMNVEFYFTTDPNHMFYDIIKATKHDALMLRWISEVASADTTSFIEIEGSEYNNFSGRLDYDFEEYLQAATTINDDGTPGLPLNSEIENLIYLGKAAYTGGGLMDMASYLTHVSRAAALKAKMNKFVKNKMLSYLDILNGTTCYNETFFYEVEKYSSTIGGAVGEKIQSFFFPNGEQKTINFIDTQVKYSTGYVYRIWKWQIVVGTDYSPRLFDTYNGSANTLVPTPTPENPDAATWKVTNPFKKMGDITASGQEAFEMGDVIVKLTPNVRIVRVPYYNVEETNQEGVLPIHSPTIVLDSPPLYPEIEFVPLIDERDQLIINIKDTIGSYKDYAHPIEQTDGGYGDEFLFEIILNQQLKNNLNLPPEELGKLSIDTNKIAFSSDDSAESFQIYLMDQKPEKYLDFNDTLADEVPGPNYAYKVRLVFNKKYYFTFRSTDIHGNVSNPTPVYEVEIVEQSGMSYPVINVLNLEEENKKRDIQESVVEYTKSGKMFLCIKPNEEQADLLSNLQTEDGEPAPESALELMPISLGVKEKGSLFGKKFKFRIKSKKTGRVFDINFTPENITSETHISSEDGFGD